MKIAIALLFALVAAASNAVELEDGATQWALLVAGSNGWWNYRHQADIAHAYKILLRRGIPAKNIIVMMYDDVAHDPSNPAPGKLFNKPDGPDVYHGIKIDYKGENVTPQNFLAVLSGNKKAVHGKGTGRVIQSGPNDHVFVNFADHGGSGILCFPEDDLNAQDLINTLKQLTKQKRYAKLVMYIEACEAGSNFDQLLPENTRILVSTASAIDESSWGYYCDYKTYPCLGDLYSINWMEHMDEKIPATENLFDQYQTIRTLTNLSHVQLYGDYTVGPSGTKDFIGPKSIRVEDDSEVDEAQKTAVSSRDVALHYFKRMAKEGSNELQKMKYAQLAEELEQKREFVDETVDKIIEEASEDEEMAEEINNTRQPLHEDMLECHKEVYHHFSSKCFNLNKNQYVLRHFYKFANLCHLNRQESAIAAIDSVCGGDFPAITNTM